ncbi:MAG TPA: EAL domain-containing protein [Acidimicrobiales bacterium]|nr:EAL domain-containing protein [Acidimicrobiales bacterium]
MESPLAGSQVHGTPLPDGDAVLQALDNPIAVVDDVGCIVSVNDAWVAAARDGGADESATGVGVNYLTICDAAVGPGAEGAREVADGLRAVLTGAAESFSADYRCATPTQERWFNVRVSPLSEGSGAVLIHHDVTPVRQAELEARAGETRLLRALDESSPIFVLLDSDATVAHVTERTCDLLGLRREDVIGADPFGFVEPVDVGRGQQALGEALSVPGGRTRIECRVLDGTGRRRVVDLTVVNMLDDPVIRAVAVTGFDVTDTRLNQIADRLKQELLEQLPAAVVAIDDGGGVVYWNQRAEHMMGVPAEEALGRLLDEIGVRSFDPAVLRTITKAARREARWEGPLDLLVPDGTVIPLHTVVERVDDDESGFHGMVAAAIDVSERRMLEHELAFQALHDPLTGLPNRRRFVERLEEALASGNPRAAVAFVDLDDFKELNDRVGHLAGDEALRTIGDRLGLVLRTDDVVARFGGDEFVVGLHGIVDTAQALAAAQRILDAVREPIEVEGTRVRLSATVGVAMANRDLGAELLIRNADAAMYEAKEQGKDRVALFDDALRERRKERRAFAARLRRAVHDGHIHAHLQPQISLSTGRLVGFEALARWEGDEAEFEDTAAFLAVAEEGGVVADIDQLVLRETCVALGRFHAERPELGCTASANVSAALLADPTFPAFVERIVRSAGIPPALLCVEVVESALADPEAVAGNLRRLERFGIEVAIDDFGTGYSSLSRIQEFHVDYLKIDRSFVASLGADSDHDAVVAAIIGLARALGLRTVAEGVETQAQADRLRVLGVDIGQGFLWSPAVPVEDAVVLVLDEPPTGPPCPGPVGDVVADR